MPPLESPRYDANPTERNDDNKTDVLQTNISDAWAPRSTEASVPVQSTSPEMAFLPFSQYSETNADGTPRRRLIGLSTAWGYSKNDAVLNPDGGKCNASGDSFSCVPDSVAQFKRTNSAPELYSSEAKANPYSTQYFTTDAPTVKSPKEFSYLEPAKAAKPAEETLVVEPLKYTSESTQEVAAITPRINDSFQETEDFERVVEKAIEWRDSAVDAFVEAIDSKKPMVMVFGDDSSPLFKRQMEELAADKDHQMSSLSKRAVFVVGRPDKDEYARRIATSLKLTDYPTISVIQPRTDALEESYRLEGYFPVSDIYSDLNKVLPPVKTKNPSPLVASA